MIDRAEWRRADQISYLHSLVVRAKEDLLSGREIDPAWHVRYRSDEVRVLTSNVPKPQLVADICGLIRDGEGEVEAVYTLMDTFYGQFPKTAEGERRARTAIELAINARESARLGWCTLGEMLYATLEASDGFKFGRMVYYERDGKELRITGDREADMSNIEMHGYFNRWFEKAAR